MLLDVARHGSWNMGSYEKYGWENTLLYDAGLL